MARGKGSGTELGAGWAGEWGTLWARRSAANHENAYHEHYYFITNRERMTEDQHIKLT